MVASHSQHVGTIYTFSSNFDDDSGGHCTNCARQMEGGALSMAQIPLTMTLLQHAADDSIQHFNTINVDAVEAYLKDHLTWKAVSVSLTLFILDTC
jgi:hypothetical protein